MTGQTEQVYSAGQVARLLGVSGGMVRRYALTYEELTGEVIPQHARDGLQFTQGHLDTLIAARRFVAGRQGVSVETGLKQALGLAEQPAAVVLPDRADTDRSIDSEALRAVLDDYVQPLLTELRTLLASNERLTEELRQARSLPDAERTSEHSTGSIGEQVARADDEIFYG